MRRRRWREYRTEGGARPVSDFIDSLDDLETAELVAAMKRVARDGMWAARHLRGDIYEIRVRGPSRNLRLLFAQEGRASQVLLSLTAFVKKTQRTPARELELAEERLSDWRARSRRVVH